MLFEKSAASSLKSDEAKKEYYQKVMSASTYDVKFHIDGFAYTMDDIVDCPSSLMCRNVFVLYHKPGHKDYSILFVNEKQHNNLIDGKDYETYNYPEPETGNRISKYYNFDDLYIQVADDICRLLNLYVVVHRSNCINVMKTK